MSIQAPKSNNHTRLQTGRLTSQTSAVVNRAHSVRKPNDITKQLDHTIAVAQKSKRDLGTTQYPGNSEPNSNNQPQIQPPSDKTATQTNADVYNGDPTYFPDVNLRPEILFLSQFKPLYGNNPTQLTKEGELFELQVSTLRNVESNANDLLKQTIGENGIKESNDRFKTQISDLRDNLQNLNSFIKKIGTYKTSLNVSYDQRYKFQPGKFVETNLSVYKNVINKFYGGFGGSDVSYELKKALIEARGISSATEIKAIQNFSSSKLFLICINELNKMIKTHSYSLYKNRQENFLVSPLLKNNSLDISAEKYNLVSLIDGDRISNQFLSSGITKFSDLTSTGVSRFITLEQRIQQLVVNNVYSQIAVIFHICFKDLIQKTRFELNKKDSSIENRISTLDSFIGYYPVKDDLVFDAATAKSNGFTGDKLSDLAFFGNLNTPEKKVLMLEDSSSNNFPTPVSSGEDYLFSSGNAENFFTTSTYRIDRVRDFKGFLDKISNQAFENLVNLGVIPIDDATVSSLGKGFTSLSSLRAFEQLFNTLVSTKQFSNGKTLLNFNFISEPEIENKEGMYTGWVKGTGIIGTYKGTLFSDNDLIALFNSYDVFGGNDKYAIINSLYSYIYHRAVGGQSSEPNFVKDVSKKIVDALINASLTMPEQPGILGDNKTLKKIGGGRSNWELVISGSLIGSKFIDKLVSFFKQFLAFEDLLPAFFYGILLIIKNTSSSSVSVYQILRGTPTESGDPYITLYTQYDVNKNKKSSLNANTIEEVISNELSIFSIGTSSAISSEMTKLLNLQFAVLNVIQTLNTNITATLNELQSLDQSIINYLLRYLNNDEKKLSILFKEPQLMLLLSTVEDLYQSYTNFSTEDADKSQLFIKKEETLPHSTKIVQMLRNYFSDGQFRFNKGYNKQIISVGIPQGLLKSLNDVLKTKNSKNAKQDDIIKVILHKIDLLNPYFIYKPKSWLFESSRFIDRVYSDIKIVEENIEIYKEIPTRNYSLFSDPNLIKNGTPYLGTDLSNAFGDEYSFLTKDEKNEILENHAASFLLENYLRLFSGLNLNELTFNLTSPDEIEAIYDSLIDKKAKQTKSLASQKATKENRAEAYRQAYSAGSGLEKAAAIAIKDPDPYISKLLQPKRFDRVFNIIFDPEFDIDYEATQTNLPDAFKKSLNGTLDDPKKYYKNKEKSYTDLDKNPQDVAMNMYFVSIETHATVSK
jgi:hypothetical protein